MPTEKPLIQPAPGHIAEVLVQVSVNGRTLGSSTLGSTYLITDDAVGEQVVQDIRRAVSRAARDVVAKAYVLPLETD